jgi:hypothetical protein
VSHVDLPPSVLWRNRQTEAHLILRPKPRNRRGDFEAQITKPEMSVLRPKLGNPPPPWFWGSTKKTALLVSTCQVQPHTAPPDLSTARPPSTRPVRPSLVLCTRSPTPATVLVVARHAAPATYTPRDKQTWFSKRTKDKRKTKQNYPEFEFKPRQVNDSS